MAQYKRQRLVKDNPHTIGERAYAEETLRILPTHKQRILDFTHRSAMKRPACRIRPLGKIFITDADFEWVMIDATYVKMHSDGTGARGSNQEIGRTKKRGGKLNNCINTFMGLSAK